MNELTEKVRNILSEYMDLDQLPGNENEPMPLDSMMLLEIIALIESETGITIPDEDIAAIDSYNSLIGTVQRRAGGAAA
jgi:acyl carrier protein